MALYRAAVGMGASPARAFFRVILPLIMPGVLAGWLFAFATSIDEIVVTLFVGGPEQVTLPRQIYSGLRERISPTVAAVATLSTLLAITMLLVVEILRKRRRNG
jgi:putative spermidine/putrescine transport system permease protein